MQKFLPTTRKQMQERGWDECDVIFVSGDAYCDHPSFGTALLSRLLESEGYRVGIIAQPDWRSAEDFKRLGRPRLFFGVTAGNMDSMLCLYTASHAKRRVDKYSPGGAGGLRPKLPTVIYTQRVKESFPGAPVVIGGIEASLRRLGYYDFWSDQLRRSILFDAKADLLVYGMGERQVIEIAKRLQEGQTVRQLRDIRGTVFASAQIEDISNVLILPSFEEIRQDKGAFLKAHQLMSAQANPYTGCPLAQMTDTRFCVQMPPALPLETEELDRLYELPYERACHPSYGKFGGVPAFKTVQTSLVSHRGCAANCSFCSLSLHQGRVIQSRSLRSLLNEARTIAAGEDFKGVINDVGGPTANMYAATCAIGHKCGREDCLWPEVCPHFKSDFNAQIKVLEEISGLDGVESVFIQSGLRYDLLLLKEAKRYFEIICREHVSGQLKIAPEHVSENVLRLMRKPKLAAYREFLRRYKELNERLGKDQYLAQYFVTAHPGCGEREARELEAFIKELGYVPEQVQDFIPLPMTRSSVMYYTGLNPDNGRLLVVPKKHAERQKQRDMVQKKRIDKRRAIR